MIKGILFDLDGTIIDSEPSRLKSSNMVLKDFNIQISQKEWNEKYKRKSSIDIFLDIKKQNNLDFNANDLYKKSHSIREKIEKKEDIKLIDGFMNFYEFLKQNKIKMIICSGGKREHIKLLLNKMNLKDISYIGREDYKRTKPNPDCWIKGLQLLNLKNNEVLLFDDSYNGILAGKNANINKLIAINCKGEKGMEKMPIFFKITNYNELNFKHLIDNN